MNRKIAAGGAIAVGSALLLATMAIAQSPSPAPGGAMDPNVNTPNNHAGPSQPGAGGPSVDIVSRDAAPAYDGNNAPAPGGYAYGAPPAQAYGPAPAPSGPYRGDMMGGGGPYGPMGGPMGGPAYRGYAMAPAMAPEESVYGPSGPPEGEYRGYMMPPRPAPRSSPGYAGVSGAMAGERG